MGNRPRWTLIEVMVLISVIGIIAAIIFGNCGHLFSGRRNWEKEDITCAWWVGYDLCLCQVGIMDTRWGFVAPHRVCERSDDNEDR
jgi:hypothetical protein